MQIFSPTILCSLLNEGLRAHDNFDETKLDLNAVLQRDALVPEGCDAQWEVEGERCAQITFLGGFLRAIGTSYALQNWASMPHSLT